MKRSVLSTWILGLVGLLLATPNSFYGQKLTTVKYPVG